MGIAELKRFHHPDISFPVIRRRITEEILEFLIAFADAAMTRGWSLRWTDWTKTPAAFQSAIYRLAKTGLIVRRKGAWGSAITVELAPKAHALTKDVLKPERFWRREWNGLWYVLAYDVPEKEREYRNAIRGFLKRKRLGCLQRSVWVTPHDVRPDYDDLVHATHVDWYSFLFEATTVLGRSSQDIVRSAWDFDRLFETQKWFCNVCANLQEDIRKGKGSREHLMTLVREEMSAYRLVMADDPLLPSALWPPGYGGEKAYKAHLNFVQTIGEAL